PQSPSAYTAFKSSGGLKDEEKIMPGINRMKTVLNRMYEEEYISKEDFEEAIDYDITKDFRKKKKRTRDTYPALTEEIQERAENILIEVLAKEDGYTLKEIKEDKNDEGLYEEYKELAKRGLEMDGYHIHSTINKD